VRFLFGSNKNSKKMNSPKVRIQSFFTIHFIVVILDKKARGGGYTKIKVEKRRRKVGRGKDSH